MNSVIILDNYQTYTLIKKNKLAIFDLDHTLIKPTHNRKFPTNEYDWIWFYDFLDKKIKTLSQEYDILIITNQSTADKNSLILKRINNFLTTLDFPIKIYIATANDYYRKPNTGIFEDYIIDTYKNIEELFYCGDAAGRKNDFSDSDLKFASNLSILFNYLNIKSKIKFYTPENYFQKIIEPMSYSGFNPINFLKQQKFDFDITTDFSDYNLFILIGPPASGKSTLSLKIQQSVKNIEIISQDKYKTKSIFIEQVKKNLAKNKNIIIDNTNATKETRMTYLKLINPKTKILYLLMSTFNDLKKDRELYEHLNIFRERKTKIKRIPHIVYNIFYKNFEYPDQEELDQVKLMTIPFIPSFINKREVMDFIQRS